MSKNKAKLFVENFLAYGAINVLNKLVPLIMLPILTRLMTDTADFGKFDMFNTIVSFGSSIAVLGMSDAMFREYFEKDSSEYRSEVTNSAFNIVLTSTMLLGIMLILFRSFFSNIFLGEKNDFIIISAAIGVIFSANKNIVSAPTRIQNKRKMYVISGLLNSFLYYLVAISLISNGFGYKGLIFSNLFAAGTVVIFFLVVNRSFFKLFKINQNIAKELFKIGLPLVPTFIIYWVYNSLDRIMIAQLLDFNQVGIYSIGARAASISSFIYMAFAGGWQYFAFSTMKDNDQVELNSNIFEYLGVISYISFLFSLVLNDFIFEILFTGDYVLGSKVFPYLFLSPLLLMLFQVSGNQFLIVKKSYLIIISLSMGAVINILLNLLLIPLYGVKGASLATLIGYMVSVLIVVIMAKRSNLIIIKPRFIFMNILVFMVTMKNFIANSSNYFAIELITIFIISILYYNDIKMAYNVFRKENTDV